MKKWGWYVAKVVKVVRSTKVTSDYHGTTNLGDDAENDEIYLLNFDPFKNDRWMEKVQRLVLCLLI